MKNFSIVGPCRQSWTDHSDEELMREIQGQDSMAFEELYRRHHVLLHGIVMKILHSECDAEDLLQAIFVGVWNGGSLQYLPSRGKPLGWLITMSRRRAIDLVRKQVSYRRICDGYHSEAMIRPRFPAGSLEHDVDTAEYRTLVSNALERLPVAQRAAIELSLFNGLSQRAISARLGVPVGTIKTRIMLAILKVKRGLASVSRDLEDVLGKGCPHVA